MNKLKLGITSLVVSLAAFLPIALAPSLHKPHSDTHVDPRELLCLARNIYHEARGEPLEGQIAVAQVTLNRVRDPQRFGNSVCSVVHEPRQFSWTLDKRKRVSDNTAWKHSITLAREILTQPQRFKPLNALYFHTRQVKPRWARTKQPVAIIGNHIFYN